MTISTQKQRHYRTNGVSSKDRGALWNRLRWLAENEPEKVLDFDLKSYLDVEIGQSQKLSPKLIEQLRTIAIKAQARTQARRLFEETQPVLQ